MNVNLFTVWIWLPIFFIYFIYLYVGVEGVTSTVIFNMVLGMDYQLITIWSFLCQHPNEAAAMLLFFFKTYSWDLHYVDISYKDLSYKFRSRSLLDETLHWFVFSEDRNVPVIIAFDLIDWGFFEIPLFDEFTLEKIWSLLFKGIGRISHCLLLGPRP